MACLRRVAIAILAIQNDHQARLIMLNVDKDKTTSLTENDTEPK